MGIEKQNPMLQLDFHRIRCLPPKPELCKTQKILVPRKDRCLCMLPYKEIDKQSSNIDWRDKT